MYLMYFLLPFFKLVDLVREESSSWQITAGFVLGFCVGLTQVTTLHGLFLWGLVLLLRTNLAACFFSAIFFHELAGLLTPVFHSLGMYLLTRVPALNDALAWMFNADVIPFTRFYNSVVLGSLVCCGLLWFPLYLLVGKLLERHQSRLLDKFLSSGLWRAIEDSRWYAFYVEYEKLR